MSRYNFGEYPTSYWEVNLKKPGEQQRMVNAPTLDAADIAAIAWHPLSVSYNASWPTDLSGHASSGDPWNSRHVTASQTVYDDAIDGTWQITDYNKTGTNHTYYVYYRVWKTRGYALTYILETPGDALECRWQELPVFNANATVQIKGYLEKTFYTKLHGCLKYVMHAIGDNSFSFSQAGLDFPNTTATTMLINKMCFSVSGNESTPTKWVIDGEHNGGVVATGYYAGAIGDQVLLNGTDDLSAIVVNYHWRSTAGGIYGYSGLLHREWSYSNEYTLNVILIYSSLS